MIPYGSALSDPAMRQALAGLAEAAQQTAQAMAAEGERRGIAQAAIPGSAVLDAGVQGALQGLAQMPAVEIQRGEQAAIPGSAVTDAGVQRVLQGLAQAPAQGAVNLCMVKNSLNGGELAPEMLARYDLPRYQMGCEKLLNMIPLAGGGLIKRPGLRHVAGMEINMEMKTRLIPFVYSSEIQMMLVLQAGDGGCDVLAVDRDGEQPPVWAGGGLPYKMGELRELSYAQCGKVLYLAHRNYPPAKLVLNDDGRSFRYEVIRFSNEVPVPSIASLEIVGIPNEAWGWRRYKVTAVNDRGRESLPSEMQELPTSALNSVFKCRITINPAPGCSEHRIYKQRGNEWGFIGRCVNGETVFDDEGYAPDTNDPPPERQQFFMGKGNYPSVVFLHQQRLGWAATDNDPLTIWMSQTSNFECLEAKTPPNDDDGIEVTLASTQANRILWCVSDRTGLAVGTSGEEWYLTGAGGEQSVAPASLSFQPQTRYGSEAGLPPVRANSSLLFVQRGGRAVRDLGYSFSADRYEAQDLALMARHIFLHNSIVDWCWQGTPMNILWCILSDGTMAALTYMPEHEVAAWHCHQTAGQFVACATMADSRGRSRLWLLTDHPFSCELEILDLPFEGLAPGETEPPSLTDGISAFHFSARCIPCIPEAGMENGSTSLRVKKINSIKLHVINSCPFQCQVSSLNSPPTTPLPIPANSPSPNDKLSRRGYADNAHWSTPIPAGFRDAPRLELILDGPSPATILGIAITMEVARESAGQV